MRYVIGKGQEHGVVAFGGCHGERWTIQVCLWLWMACMCIMPERMLGSCCLEHSAVGKVFNVVLHCFLWSSSYSRAAPFLAPAKTMSQRMWLVCALGIVLREVWWC